MVLASCAAQRPLPPGDELEYPEGQDPDTRRFEQPAASDDELAKAFDAPQPSAASSPEPFSEEAVPPPPSPPLAAPPPSPSATEQAKMDAKRQFDGALPQAKRCVDTSNAAGCDEPLRQLEALADLLTPRERQLTQALHCRDRLARKDLAEARRAAERWILECGPDRPDACRAKAFGALSRVAKDKGAAAQAARERLEKWRSADDCVFKAEAAGRAKQPMPSCLEGAAAHYRRFGDRLMLARIHLARGSALSKDEAKAAEAAGHFKRAESACTAPQCAQVRRRALKQLAYLHWRSGDLEVAARAFFAELGLATEDLPSDRQRYARTDELEKICAQYDKKHTAGACRRLEKSTLGRYTFLDFSKRRGRGLSPESVRRVNEHYRVLLEECLSAQAERMRPPSFETFAIQWTVGNDGRVRSAKIDRKEHDAGELGRCVREQFAHWRYPQYTGEGQHVEQSFTVSARERRSASASPR